MARLLRESNSVTSTPSTSRAGLICRLTRSTVFKRPAMPDAGRYSAETGMSTLSAATKALTGMMPSVGAQSMMM